MIHDNTTRVPVNPANASNGDGRAKSTPPPNVRDAALAAWECGLSVLPPREDGSKAPLGAWKQYQERRATRAEILAWYGENGQCRRSGLGLVCGSISGGLELFEFDCSVTYRRFKEAATSLGLGELVKRIEGGYLESTPGGGIHWLLYCQGTRECTKLARRHKTPDEYTDSDREAVAAAEARGHVHNPVKTLIETKDEGGFVIVAPSNGRVHPTGGAYILRRGGFDSIATVTPAELRSLWDLARSFDRMPEPVHAEPPEARAHKKAAGDWPDTVTPWDDYNARTDWGDLLPGWTRVYEQGDTEYWRRPGKDEGVSATIRKGSGGLYVFSTSTDFEPLRPYSKFDAYTRLNHGGDSRAAVAALSKAGFGTFKAWVLEEGEPILKTLPNPCPPGGKVRIARPGEPPPNPPRGGRDKVKAGPGANGDGRGDGSTHEPSANGVAAHAPPPFANYFEMEVTRPGEGKGEEGGEPKTVVVKVALRVAELDALLQKIAPGWPKRVEEGLFLEGPGHRPVYLNSSTRLFAWIDTLTQTAWTKGTKFVTQERYFEHLRMNAEQYVAIETLPHFPPMPGTYYMHRPVATRGGGGHLDEFLDFFRPYTPEDRELIRAYIMTSFWGGKAGGRPAWLFTGPDDDIDQGRGIGKSTISDVIAEEILGGYVDVSPNDDMEKIKTRLLSDAGLSARVVRLDNVKTLRFSWGELENMITAGIISGHRMYQGEGRRPNTLVWSITLNGASLSKDMAQRSIVIKLARPRFSANWEQAVREFARRHRWDIIADIRKRLEDEQGYVATTTRWAAWESGVLSRTDMLAECQKIIAERQGAIDDDAGTTSQVALFFAKKLEELGYDPKYDAVIIPSEITAQWLSEATRTRYATNAASTCLRGLGIPNLTKHDGNDVRGWAWRGADSDPKSKPTRLRPIPAATTGRWGDDFR